MKSLATLRAGLYALEVQAFSSSFISLTVLG